MIDYLIHVGGTASICLVNRGSVSQEELERTSKPQKAI
jgi:hypothetical protein